VIVCITAIWALFLCIAFPEYHHVAIMKMADLIYPHPKTHRQLGPTLLLLCTLLKIKVQAQNRVNKAKKA